MSYRNTDAPDDSQVQLTLTLGQVKTLDALVESELADAENGCGPYEEEPLKRLIDRFFPHLYIKLTEKEEQAKIADLSYQWTREELHALNAQEGL